MLPSLEAFFFFFWSLTLPFVHGFVFNAFVPRQCFLKYSQIFFFMTLMSDGAVCTGMLILCRAIPYKSAFSSALLNTNFLLESEKMKKRTPYCLVWNWSDPLYCIKNSILCFLVARINATFLQRHWRRSDFRNSKLFSKIFKYCAIENVWKKNLNIFLLIYACYVPFLIVDKRDDKIFSSQCSVMEIK